MLARHTGGLLASVRSVGSPAPTRPQAPLSAFNSPHKLSDMEGVAPRLRGQVINKPKEQMWMLKADAVRCNISPANHN
jgi:hypothetical protein